MKPIPPLQPNYIRYLVEQNKWTELTNHIMALQGRVAFLEFISEDYQWQPIETAPLHGEVLLACVGHDNLRIGERLHKEPDVSDYLKSCWVISSSGNVCQPTHWMPLPKAPAGF